MKQGIPMTKAVALATCLLLILMFAGCSKAKEESKINRENYEKIKIGMNYEDVLGIIGKPGKCEEPVIKTKSCTWESSGRQIKIKFVFDKVAWRSSEGL